MPLHNRSIVVLRYAADPAKGYATGFFVDTKNYGRVCVTAAHVFRKGRHPGPDRTFILVNGKLAKLKYDAFEDRGIDVALVSIPEDFDSETIVFHTPGVSLKGESAFYAHAWSGPKADPSALTFTKIWGVRFGPADVIDNDADPIVAMPVKRWKLRSDVANRDRSEPAIFQPGWSGAPVFNVRTTPENQRVIGVLSKHLGDREAFAVSVESLDFLEPRERQDDDEPARGGTKSQRPGRSPADSAGTVGDVAALRYREIMGQRICPKIPQPRSPYDPLP